MKRLWKMFRAWLGKFCSRSEKRADLAIEIARENQRVRQRAIDTSRSSTRYLNEELHRLKTALEHKA